MVLRRIPAHDGLELVSYLTRAYTEGSSPLVLLVHGGEKIWHITFFDPLTPCRACAFAHGKQTPPTLIYSMHQGPWARDYWGFNAMAQWFANRGYSTLQVNYRGSTGYGKTFLHKGDKQWGVGDMQHDLTSAVTWAIEEGIADKNNICIYGGSYGGYACLAGLTFTPDI